MAENEKKKFILRYSNYIIEHLGVKLYQNKPTNALAELVSNAWDADASSCWIDFNLTGKNEDWSISVGDDGLGMSDDEIINEYLVIGRKKRIDPADTTLGGRPLMGRKGIGKLAPFGIATEVDVFTVKEGQVSWLTFMLDEMLKEENEHKAKSGSQEGEDDEVAVEKTNEYEPTVNYSGQIALFDPKTDSLVSKFLLSLQEATSENPSGTLIVLKKLSFTNKSWVKPFPQNLASRFIPALGETGFQVLIDNKKLELEDVLPKSGLRIPSDKEWETKELSDGRSIRYWALVVDLNHHKKAFDEDWTQERAGVAIYAHKKVAQERPFFFDRKGREIYTRYLYGVIEADWVDELPSDVISTDRTALNWDHPELKELREVGRALIGNWISSTAKHLKDKNKDKVQEKVKEKLKQVRGDYREKFSEEEVSQMAEQILALNPSASVDKVIDITISAVAHLPSWELLKTLVDNIVSGEMSQDIFGQIVFDLRFFENVNLAQVIARRLQAMKALEKLILLGAREVTPKPTSEIGSIDSMHDLFKNNPWMLDLRWAAVADELPPQLALEAQERVEKKMKKRYKEEIFEFESWKKVGERAIDFFLLHVTEFESAIIIVEIKRANKTLSTSDYRQLEDYINEVSEELDQTERRDWKIKGILIGGKKGRQIRTHLDNFPNNEIRVMSWRDFT